MGVYTYEDLQKAIDEGHLGEMPYAKKTVIAQAKVLLEEVTLSNGQRNDKMTAKEVKSRYTDIIKQNAAPEGCSKRLPVIDIVRRINPDDPSIVELHNCNGWHTTRTIAICLGWKLPNMTSAELSARSQLDNKGKRELEECEVDIRIWTAFDDEGERAIWLFTNGLAAPIKSGQNRSSEFATHNSEWGKVLAEISAESAEDELSSFAAFIKANGNRSTINNAMSRIVAQLTGEVYHDSGYYFGTMGGSVDANACQAIDIILDGNGRSKLYGVINAFMEWAAIIEQKAPWMIVGEFSGETSVDLSKKSIYRETALVAACIRNEEKACAAFRNLDEQLWSSAELRKKWHKVRTTPIVVHLLRDQRVDPATAEARQSRSPYTFEAVVQSFETLLKSLARGRRKTV